MKMEAAMRFVSETKCSIQIKTHAGSRSFGYITQLL